MDLSNTFIDHSASNRIFIIHEYHYNEDKTKNNKLDNYK
jgi:hypothetical protein